MGNDDNWWHCLWVKKCRAMLAAAEAAAVTCRRKRQRHSSPTLGERTESRQATMFEWHRQTDRYSCRTVACLTCCWWSRTVLRRDALHERRRRKGRKEASILPASGILAVSSEWAVKSYHFLFIYSRPSFRLNSIRPLSVAADTGHIISCQRLSAYQQMQ